MHLHDDDDLPDLDEAPNDKQLNFDIDEALAKARPERYDADDKDWMDSVVAAVGDQLGRRSTVDILHDAAKRRVYRREAEATKHTNRILRDINETGQLPIGWGDGDNWRLGLFDLLHMPLSIARKRVRLGVASARDLEQWELESAREEDKRRAAQISARRGSALLSQWMRQQGVDRVEDLKATPADRADDETPAAA